MGQYDRLRGVYSGNAWPSERSGAAEQPDKLAKAQNSCDKGEKARKDILYA